VMLVSVELDEVMSLSDRIIVLYRGEIAGEVDPRTVTEREIGLLMGGSSLAPAQPKMTAMVGTSTAAGRERGK